MAELTFVDKLIEKIREKRTLLNVGLDPQMNFMPPHLIRWAFKNYGEEDGGRLSLVGVANLYRRFNFEIIDAVLAFAVSVKLNIAFYEAYGRWGIRAFEETIRYAKSKDLLVITDGKRGDGGDTARAYAQGHLGEISLPVLENENIRFESAVSPIRVDALTLNAWIGSSCLQPFLEVIKKYGTGVFVVAKTSFQPNSEIEQIITQSGLPNWKVLAQMIKKWGEGTEGKYGYQNLGVVAGATFPGEAQELREILPKAWFLIPGYGAQGGGLQGAVVGINNDGFGGIVNSSRGIIAAWKEGKFKSRAEDFAKAAAKAAEFSKDELNQALKQAGKLNW